METTESPILKNAAQAAGIIAAVMISIQLVVFILNSKSIFVGMAVGLVSLVLYIAGMVIYGKKYRAERPDGLIEFKDIFLYLIYVAGIYSAIMIVYSFLYYKVIDPNYVQKAIEGAQNMLDKMNVPENAREEAIEKIKASSSFAKTMRSVVISNVGLGVVVSLIVAAVLKKKDKSMDALMKELE